MTFNFDKCHGITFKMLVCSVIHIKVILVILPCNCSEKEDEDRFNKKKVRPFQAETTQAGSSHSSGPSRQGARGGFIPFKKFVFLKRKKIIPANKRWVPYHQFMAARQNARKKREEAVQRERAVERERVLEVAVEREGVVEVEVERKKAERRKSI
ncbi:uncharacterized protein LOC144742512 isoform X3 [Ciona intestinalis]